MNETERLNLQKMIQANDAEDKTEQIRQLKHSQKIYNDVQTLLKIKQDNIALLNDTDNMNTFDNLCSDKCNFLFTHYTDIFNRVKKDEIDLQILNKLLTVLRSIEEGQLGQHEASFEIGKVLKEIYIDSALRKSANLDKQHDDGDPDSKEDEIAKAEPVNISWSQFKAKSA
tara:strand:+ start:12109 stop:12621 length:513 start_codon:yes stop_codon:yes gene_type:complete